MLDLKELLDSQEHFLTLITETFLNVQTKKTLKKTSR